jgi:putative membrane protein
MKRVTLKNKSGLKEVLLEVVLVCVVAITLITFQSCDDNKHDGDNRNEKELHGDTDNNMNAADTRTEDPKDVAEDHNDAKFNKDAEKEAQFMVDAAELSLKEIKLGNLAQSKGTNKQIKDLGKMMVSDHTKSLDELKKLAKEKKVTLPESLTEKGIEDHDKLSEKSGRDFDKKYSEMMVDGHEDAIKKFEKCGEDCTDSQLKNWVTQTLPTLRNHLDHAMSCRDAYKNDKSDKKMK